MYTSEWKVLQSMRMPRCCFSLGCSPFILPETLEGYVSAFLLNGELVVLAGAQLDQLE